MEADGNVIGVVDWDEQDANDKLYHWILAVSNKEENGEEQQWEPLDVRQIYEEMEAAGHPFVEQRTSAELASSGEEDEKSSGPPGMQSSSDDEPEAEAPKAVDQELTTDEDDSDSDVAYLEDICKRFSTEVKTSEARPAQSTASSSTSPYATKAWKARKRAQAREKQAARRLRKKSCNETESEALTAAETSCDDLQNFMKQEEDNKDKSKWEIHLAEQYPPAEADKVTKMDKKKRPRKKSSLTGNSP